MPEPREPHDIAQEIIDADEGDLEELLQDTEVEDPDFDSDEEGFEIPDEPLDSQDDDIEYF